MKKYVPIFISILIFAFYLVTQVVFKYEDSNAEIDTKKQKYKIHLENTYRTSEIFSIDNKRIKLSEIKTPVVILNFWASWCVPCLEEFPSLIKLKKLFPDKDLRIFGMNADDSDHNKKIKKIMEKFEFNFPIILDKKGSHLTSFKIESIPSTLIFHKGKLVQYSEGKLDFEAEEIKLKIKSWLQEI